MILTTRNITMAEVKEITEKNEAPNTELKGYLKKFQKLSFEKAKEMEKELQDLGLLQLKIEHIVKIIDMLPETQEELLKILIDVSLSEDERNKILEISKRYR